MLIHGILHKRANQVLKLECSLGQFSIYDTQFQSLADGAHVGIFELAQIKANMQSSTNDQGLATLTLEVIAELKSCAFSAAKPDEKAQEKPSKLENVGIEQEPESLGDNSLSDKELFGELWPLGNRVKLDETHPNFRAQLKRMKEFKEDQQYTYIGGVDKVWIKLGQV